MMSNETHFWRQAGAFLLDMFVAITLAGLLLIPPSILMDFNLGALGVARSGECSTADPSLPVVKALEKLLSEEVVKKGEIAVCHSSLWGYAEQRTFVAKVPFEALHGAEVQFNTETINVAIDQQGNPILRGDFPPLTLPLALPILAYFIASGKRSPGKAMMSLSVRKLDGSALSYGIALKREAIKIAPLLAWFMTRFVLYLTQPTGPKELETLLVAKEALPYDFALSAFFFIATFLWWLIPFVFWQGATWHDKWSGTKIEMTERKN